MAVYIPDRDILALLSEIIGKAFILTAKCGIGQAARQSDLAAPGQCVYERIRSIHEAHDKSERYYIRYADDFVIFSPDKAWLESLSPRMADFLRDRLKLRFHPNKISLRTVASGVDYLGWVQFSEIIAFYGHRQKSGCSARLRTSGGKPEVVASYLGLISHGNSRGLQVEVEKLAQKYEEPEKENV